MKKLLLTLIAASVVMTGCATASDTDTVASTEETPDIAETTTPDEATMPEMEGMEASEGNVEITLVSPEEAVPMGDAELIVAVKDAATGEPVTTENLIVDIYMPMDGMEPMLTEAEVSPEAEPGQYKVSTYLGMEGTWVSNVTVDEGEQQGKAHFMFEAQ